MSSSSSYTSTSSMAATPGGPLLGSAYLTSQSAIPPSSPSELNTSLCFNVSLFKSTLKRYRELDDAITTRLNREGALQRRDTQRPGLPAGALDVLHEGQRNTCLVIWRDILESWKRREGAIRYCVSAVDERLVEKERVLHQASSQQGLDYSRLDANRAESLIRDELFSEQVKRQQLHNELSVESIIRRRTLAAFFSRCPDFVPPPDSAGGPAVPEVDLQPMPMPRRPVNL